MPKENERDIRKSSETQDEEHKKFEKSNEPSSNIPSSSNIGTQSPSGTKPSTGVSGTTGQEGFGGVKGNQPIGQEKYGGISGTSKPVSPEYGGVSGSKPTGQQYGGVGSQTASQKPPTPSTTGPSDLNQQKPEERRKRMDSGENL